MGNCCSTAFSPDEAQYRHLEQPNHTKNSLKGCSEASCGNVAGVKEKAGEVEGNHRSNAIEANRRPENAEGLSLMRRTGFGCLACLRKPPAPTAAPAAAADTSRGSNRLLHKLLSLQSSSSLIPALLLGSGSPSGSEANLTQLASPPPAVTDPSNGAAAGDLSVQCTGSKASNSTGNGSQKRGTTHSSGGSGPVGLTLVVSSHSNSSHQGSPTAAGSSRASSDSGHTAFASLPSSICPSGSVSPDSMLSAFSTASSNTLSSSSSSMTGWPRTKSTGVPCSILAAAAVAAAAAATCQQQAGTQLQQQLTGSKHQTIPDSDTEQGSDSNSAPPQQQQQQQQQGEDAGRHSSPPAASLLSPQQQQQQQHVSFQGVASEPSSPEHQQPVFGSSEVERPQPFWVASGWSFGSHSEQNLRAYMEDRTVAVDLTGHVSFPPCVDRAGLFSVYDGHGGHQVAEFLAEHVRDKLLSAGTGAMAASPLTVLGAAVEDAERELLVSYAEGGCTTAAAGSTLCAVLLLNDKLHVAHVGDSRAVLARGSIAKQLTRDHKPGCEIEARRIRSDDPEAEISSDGYLYSELAVARAIGSAHLKRDPSKRALIATAETATVQLERQDDFVIVATDGLWDSVSSSEAVSVARRVLADSRDAGAASRALVERAQRCGSNDNISVVTLLLHGRRILVPRSNSRLFKRPTPQQLGAGGSGTPEAASAGGTPVAASAGVTEGSSQQQQLEGGTPAASGSTAGA